MAKDCDSLEMILFKLSNTWVSCDTPSPPRGPQSDKCSKVLVVTHEMSAIENEGRHIDDVFRPYPVHYILGRSYKAQPTCPPGQCLYFTWKVQPLGNLGHGSLEYWHLLVCSLFLRRPVIFQTHPHEKQESRLELCKQNKSDIHNSAAYESCTSLEPSASELSCVSGYYKHRVGIVII